MKKSLYSFLDPDIILRAKNAANNNNNFKVFDWDKAAQIIKEMIIDHPDLIAEAGLQDDWEYTGGIIFEDGYPTNDSYTYLYSIWAIPTLIISYSNEEQFEFECYTEDPNTRFHEKSK